MHSNVNKRHILQVGTRKKNKYEMNGTKLESVQCVKDLGVSVASSLKFSQECKDVTSKANRMLGFINRNILIKTKDVILPVYTILVRPHLEYAVQFWAPHHVKDIVKLEAVQQRVTKMITSLNNKPYEESMARLNEGSEEKLSSVLKSLNDLRMWKLARCSRLITHHEQGAMGKTKI